MDTEVYGGTIVITVVGDILITAMVTTVLLTIATLGLYAIRLAQTFEIPEA